MGVCLWHPDSIPKITVFALEIAQNRFQILKKIACGGSDLSRSPEKLKGGIFS